jgi:predicted patatin/cPLA2 family phospholipase
VVFPFLLTRWANKKMQEFQQQAQHQFKTEEQTKQFVKQHEGEVKIQSTTKNNKSASGRTGSETDGLGDYVDYEEVK